MNRRTDWMNSFSPGGKSPDMVANKVLSRVLSGWMSPRSSSSSNASFMRRGTIGMRELETGEYMANSWQRTRPELSGTALLTSLYIVGGW